jgi:hypothetical protein
MHLALTATTPSKRFFAYKNPACKYHTLYIIVQYCILFSLLQVKNKLREGVKTPAFILGPISMIWVNGGTEVKGRRGEGVKR